MKKDNIEYKASDTFRKAAISAGGIAAGYYSDEFINQVNNRVDELVKSLNQYKGYKTDIKQLKGNIFEAYHSGTYNIDASIKLFGIHNIFGMDIDMAIQNKENGFASVDITSNLGEYSLKDYSTSEKSGIEQAINYIEFYKKARARSKNPDFPPMEAFYKAKGIDNINEIKYNSIYEGQIRLIPSDQLKDALKILKEKAIKESVNRPDEAYRYIETYNNLVDRIYGPNGTESIPMTKEQSVQLTRAIKEGNFKKEDFGLDIEALIEMEIILKRAKESGVAAATITMLLTSSKTIISFIMKSLKNEKVTLEDFANGGIEVLSATTQSFIRGYLVGLITSNMKLGKFGMSFVDVSPYVIGTVVAVISETITISYKLIKGNINQREFNYESAKAIFVATSSLAITICFEVVSPIPVIGALIGNFIGTIMGAIVYDSSSKVFLSFCANTGYTFFGIVEQDYELPEKVLKEMGLDTIRLDEAEVLKVEEDTCEYDTCEIDICNQDMINTYTLNRGVIGVNKIGYFIS